MRAVGRCVVGRLSALENRHEISATQIRFAPSVPASPVQNRCASAAGDVPRVVRRRLKQQPDHHHHHYGRRRRYARKPKCNNTRAVHNHARPYNLRNDSCTKRNHARWNDYRLDADGGASLRDRRVDAPQ
jgi:hypothetical protein